MSDTVIKVENLWKQYRLGTVGTGTLAHDLNRWWHKIRGKEDPYLKIVEENDRTKKGESEYVWALRDINFEVKRGEVLGIIGKNGAGKSTLLKILSQVTTPTKGYVKIKGRIASLLEVGTGFHPELTGRENIFLNGAILGMTKAEIRRKFDEIVDFSGVERYIDTPVKRYSSGMYVRLAFAVAAHLDPEILIVDEVLAVGDAEFQKKCLGKMKDVSGVGRTVLFVSHNMESVAKLCTSVIWFEKGKIRSSGNTSDMINRYLYEMVSSESKIILDEKKDLDRHGQRKHTRILEFEIRNLQDENSVLFNRNEEIVFLMKVELLESNLDLEFGVAVSNLKGVRFHHLVSSWKGIDTRNIEKQVVGVRIETSGIQLYPGDYAISIWSRKRDEMSSDDFVENITTITIAKVSEQLQEDIDRFASNGGVFLNSKWSLISKQ